MTLERQKDRILTEMLEGEEPFTESDGGPEGPWEWDSLKLKRIDNLIHVYDVDGHAYRILEVPDFSKGPDWMFRFIIRLKLDELHEKSLAEL
jgi:hypothetical protein